MIELDDVVLTLQGTLKTLDIERRALVTAGASPEEVMHRDVIISAVKQGQAVMIAEAARLREEDERAKKYAVAYPLACELKEKVETAFHVHEKAELEYVTAEKNVQIIDTAIAEHNSCKPKPQNLPSAKETRKWALRVRHLEEMREERKATLRQRVKERGEARAEWSRLKNAFDQAAFQARYYAPREKAAKPIAVAWTVPSSAPSRVSSL